MKPTAPQERIAELDVARGAAILGLLLVNIRHFAFPSAGELCPTLRARYAGTDAWAFYFISLAVEYKLLSLLAFLFGASFALQQGRWDSTGSSFQDFYARWLALLAFLGLLHGVFLWYGDILLLYALVGWIALRLRSLDAGSSVRLALALLLAGGLGVAIVLAAGVGSSSSAGFGRMYEAALAQVLRRQTYVYTRGSWSQTTLLGAGLFAGLAFFNPVVLGPRVLALFLLGGAMIRADLWDRLRRDRGLARILMTAGAAAGLALEGLTVWLEAAGRQGRWALALEWLGHYFGSLGLALFYFTALVYLCGFPRLRSWARPLAAAGRMALTNYLLQSAVCVLIFYPYGLGWFGKLSLAGCLGLAALVGLIQGMVSVLWLRVFRFGPLEWLTRALAYGDSPPLRRTAEAS